MLYGDLITLFGRPHKTHKCKTLSSAAFAVLECKGPHTQSNSLRNADCCANCLIVCDVVWLFVQQFDDFQTDLSFVAQQSGCATV